MKLAFIILLVLAVGVSNIEANDHQACLAQGLHNCRIECEGIGDYCTPNRRTDCIRTCNREMTYQCSFK